MIDYECHIQCCPGYTRKLYEKLHLVRFKIKIRGLKTDFERIFYVAITGHQHTSRWIQ